MSLEQTREGVSVERTCTKGWQQDPKDQGLGLHTEERGEASLATHSLLPDWGHNVTSHLTHLPLPTVLFSKP